MSGVGVELLIAGLVAGTFGFGSVDSGFARLARVLSFVLLAGFAYCLAMSAIEARRPGARTGRKTKDSDLGRAPLAL
jgi:uncharacterized membrane protein YtjA (UPF0391 family)